MVPAPPLVMCERGRCQSSKLRGPHLVLAHVRDHATVPCAAERRVERGIDVVRHQLRRCSAGASSLPRLMRRLHLADVREPARGAGVWQTSSAAVAQRPAGRPHQCRPSTVTYLADLGRIDVHVDDPRLGANVEALPVTRSSKRPPTLSSTSHSWMARFTCTQPCMPGMPKRQWMILGEGAEPVQRGDHRDAGALGQRAQFVAAPDWITPCPT